MRKYDAGYTVQKQIFTYIKYKKSFLEKKSMKTLICIDRDGTLINDTKNHLFLGSKENWKEEVLILPTVIQGLEVLKKLADTRIYMITNQSGVAIKELPLLTEERSHEVCEYVLSLFENEGVALDGFFACPHATLDYFKGHDFFTPIPELICECDCIKPRLGMVISALEKEGADLTNVSIYVIGDRVSDVMTGINTGGKGVLIPFESQPGETEKMRSVDSQKSYVAENFLDAAKHIYEQESK